jgi:hypothetical protein
VAGFEERWPLLLRVLFNRRVLNQLNYLSTQKYAIVFVKVIIVLKLNHSKNQTRDHSRNQIQTRFDIFRVLRFWILRSSYFIFLTKILV